MSFKTYAFAILVSGLSLAVNAPPACEKVAAQFGKEWTCGPNSLTRKSPRGATFLLENSSTKTFATAKVVEATGEEAVRSMEQELEVLGQVRHKNIVRLRDHKRVGDPAQSGNGGKVEYYELLELGEHVTLTSLIQSNPELFENPRFVLRMFRGILEAVAALHAKRLVHCDLRPHNVVVTAKHLPKIIDFDSAVREGENWPVRGVSGFQDPRLLLHHISSDSFEYDFEVDVYSLGVTLYSMVHKGRVPYSAKTVEGLYKAIKDTDYLIRKGVERTTALIISKCLQLNSRDRPTINALLDIVNPYLRSTQDMFIESIETNPSKELEFADLSYSSVETVSEEARRHFEEDEEAGDNASNQAFPKKNAEKGVDKYLI